MSYGNNQYGQGGDPYAQGGGDPSHGGYGQSGQSDYGQQGGYGEQGGYGQQGGYSPGQSDFGQQGGYSEQSAYPQQGGYEQQGGYQQGAYDQGQAGYPVQQGYGAPGYAGGYGGGYDAAHPPRPPVGIVQAIKQFFMNYANFYGRANRGEYWWVALALFVVNLLISIPGTALGTSDGTTITMNPIFTGLQSIVNLVTLVPSIAIAVRRLHDTGRSGWWNLIVLVPFVGWIILLVLLAGGSKPEGVRFDNPDGSQPKIATA